MESVQRSELKIREWVSAVLVLMLVTAMSTQHWFKRVRIEERVAQSAQEMESVVVQLKVSGAVKRPGIYTFKPGISLKEALQSIELEKSADRRKIPLKKILYASEEIFIPHREKGEKKRR